MVVTGPRTRSRQRWPQSRQSWRSGSGSRSVARSSWTCRKASASDTGMSVLPCGRTGTVVILDMRHRPDQAEMLGQGGQARMKLADAHPGDRGGDGLVGAADLRGRLGFHVPGIEVAGPAAQEDEDAGLLGRTAAKSPVAIDAR